LMKTDKNLQKDEFVKNHEKFGGAADEDAVSATVAALEAKKHVVKVFDTAEECLEHMKSLPKKGSTISAGFSTTLKDIGWYDFLKTTDEFDDCKSQALAKQKDGDSDGYNELMNKGLSADYFFTSCAAVSQTGDIVWGSLTGTRVAGNTSKNLVFVVGTNKIVADYQTAMDRLYDYQYPLESARANLVYGFASNVNEMGAIRGANPFMPHVVHICIIRGVYGF